MARSRSATSSPPAPLPRPEAFVICVQTIERFFNRLKQFRRVATRYDKLLANFRGFVQLAASPSCSHNSLPWSRNYHSPEAKIFLLINLKLCMLNDVRVCRRSLRVSVTKSERSSLWGIIAADRLRTEVVFARGGNPHCHVFCLENSE